MRFREAELGKGTLGYTGESPEYWAAKARRGPIVTLVLSIVLVVAGVVLFSISTFPGHVHVVPGQVQAVDAARGTLTVSYVDGSAPARTAVVKVTQSNAIGTYAAGEPVDVTVGAGAVKLGDQTGSVTVNRWSGIALFLIGVALPVVMRKRSATTPGPTGE
jgi:hypothetical protein